MPTQDFDIVGSYNNQRIKGIDAERTVNMFEYVDPLGKKPQSLIYTSGLANSNIEFKDASGAFRGQFVFLSNMFVVIGSNVYLIDSSLTSTKLNVTPLATDKGYVGIDANNASPPQIIFVDGLNGYIYDSTLGFRQITDTNFPTAPIDVCYLDGFFIVANGGTNQFQLSQLNQGMVWGNASDTFTASSATDLLTVPSTLNYQTGVAVIVSTSGGGTLPNPLVTATTYYVINISPTTIKLATSFQNAITNNPINLTSDGTATDIITSTGQLQEGSITSHPGNIVACRTLHRRLFLFSLNYTEVWENAGAGTNLPFRRNNSLLMEYGTPSLGSVVTGFDRMFFLSQDRDGLGSVMEVLGTQPIPASTNAIDFTLTQYAENPSEQGVSDARGILIKENGLIFYRLNFTKANHTFVFGVTMSNEQNLRWHEEETLEGNRHPAQTHGYFQGTNFYGSYLSPILYIVNDNYYTNDGENIKRMRISKPFTPPAYQRTRIDRFQLDVQQGDIAISHLTDSPLVLLTEDGFVIQTESGENILLEQGVQFSNVQIPYVYLSISKDGGQSYGNIIKAPMGNVGQRTFRTLWRKLGVIPRGQGFIVKLEFYDAIPYIILGAAWAMEVLPE